MSDIKGQLIKNSYNYVLQSDLITGIVYRIGGDVPTNPKFISGLTVNANFTYSNGTEFPGYVLTCDAAGNAVWSPVSGSTSSVVVTGFTYDDSNNLTIKQNEGQSDLTVNVSIVTGLTSTGDINISGNTNVNGYVQFDDNSSETSATARLTWNDTDGTLDLGLKGGNVVLQIGQEQLVRVVNKTGANLLESNYQAVRIDGAQGNRVKITLAQANNDANSIDTIGLVTEDINNNQEGFVTTMGLVRSINTTGSLQGESWTDGDILYLSPTVAGRITNIKPISPQHTIIIGYVVQSNPSNGSIFVKVDNGYELEELHNVLVTDATDGQVLTYSASTALWVPTTISGGTDVYVTGGTYNSGTTTLELYNNTGGTIVITGFTSGGSGGGGGNSIGQLTGDVVTSAATTSSELVTSVLKNNLRTGSFGVTVDGVTGVIQVGQVGYVEMTYSGNITGWSISANISGSVVFDVWKLSGNLPTNVNTIIGVGGNKPTLSSQDFVTSTTMTNWDTSFTSGDVFAFYVESASTLKRATLTLRTNKT